MSEQHEELMKKLRQLDEEEVNHPINEIVKEFMSKDTKNIEKKKKKWQNPDRVDYKVTKNNFVIHMMELACMINDINTDHYFQMTSMGMVFGNDFRINKKFRKLSSLGWGEQHELSSMQFRGKFITQLLMFFVDNITDIVKNYTYCTFKDTSFDFRRSTLKAIMIKVDYLITCFLTQDVLYHKALRDVLGITNFLSMSKEDAKNQNKINEACDFFMATRYDKGYEDYLIWNNALKVAYMISTGDRDFSKIHKMNEHENIKEAAESHIKKLGKAIEKHVGKKHRYKHTMYYGWFSIAGPKYTTKFKSVNDDYHIALGMKAIYALLFLMDDDHFTSFINQYI